METETRFVIRLKCVTLMKDRGFISQKKEWSGLSLLMVILNFCLI